MFGVGFHAAVINIGPGTYPPPIDWGLRNNGKQRIFVLAQAWCPYFFISWATMAMCFHVCADMNFESRQLLLLLFCSDEAVNGRQVQMKSK